MKKSLKQWNFDCLADNLWFIDQHQKCYSLAECSVRESAVTSSFFRRKQMTPSYLTVLSGSL